jgi:hypothetical protein
MVPAFLFPESSVREDGHGAEVLIEPAQGAPLLLTLGITRILERESLDVSIWGSADGLAWQSLASFPTKSFCGTYSLPVDLSGRADVRYLRTQWKMSRWDRRKPKPIFDFYVFVEQLKMRVAGAA